MIKNLLNSKGIYALVAIVDLILVFVIFINGLQPAKRMITPVISSLKVIQPLNSPVSAKETFSFAPGLSQNKLKKINFQELNYLSFFDLSLTSDGLINTQSRGYASLKSEKTARVIETAHFNNTKVLITLTQTNSEAIMSFLGNIRAQEKLISQAIEEVKDTGTDGVTLDFEPKYPVQGYQKKFSDFILRFKERIHFEIPRSMVAVSIPASNYQDKGIYDLGLLAGSCDKVLVMAADIIVPETKNGDWVNPVYGFNEKEYRNKLADTFAPFLSQVPPDKLVMERAWYGNGSDYPLYSPSGNIIVEETKKPGKVLLDEITIESLIARVPVKSRAAARMNIPIIGKALEDEGILDSNVLAYALATIEHETNGTFEPIDEIAGRFSARRLGYEGGQNYFGRGFLQLTHLRNYKIFGERIGMGDSLVKEPRLASTPEVAAKILAAFFKDNNVASLASRGYFIAARKPINPDINGRLVARLASKYEI